MSAQYENSVNKILDEVRNYDYDWVSEVTKDDVREDDRFLYVEITNYDDIWDEILELGYHMDAKSIAEVDGEERYLISVER